jgi:hypothetical protein
MILSSSSCLTHQKIRRFVYGKAWAIDARSPSAGSPTISATLACIFEHPGKRAIASDSFAARRLDLHRRELRPPTPSIASPRSGSTHRRREMQGARLGLFAMTLRRQGRGGHGGPGALRDKLRPIFVCGSENMDREAIEDYGITVTRPPLRNRCPGTRVDYFLILHEDAL